MAQFTRTAEAVWHGTGLEGSGTLTGPSGVLDNTPYSTQKRFQNADGALGTNPEELIAAAHAGCFVMALSFKLTGAGFAPEALHCKSHLHMDKSGNDWFVASITLELDANVPGIDPALFQELAEAAKSTCPVSKALSAVPIELTATLS